jgi:hypothetical protein
MIRRSWPLTILWYSCDLEKVGAAFGAELDAGTKLGSQPVIYSDFLA